jgi:drug efflux transport system permease protein
MTILQHILALAIKEFRALLRDKRSRFVVIGPPIIQLLVFGYAATFDVTRVPFAVYDADGSAAARELQARFDGASAFDYVGHLRSDEEVAESIDERRIMMVLRLGPDFGRRLARGETGDAQLIIDGRNSNTALIVLGYARRIVTDFNADWAASHGQRQVPATLRVRSRYNENLESRWFIVPGIVALLTLVVTLVVTALSVAREREAGTFDQLLVTPLRPAEILIGKALPGLVIGTAEATFIVLMVVFWFEIPLRGELLALYVGIWLFLLSAIGIGLVISSLSATQQQGMLGAFLFLVPAVILSGFATPVENMPHVVQYLTYVNPMRYILVIVRAVFLQGADAASLTSQYWPMAVISITTLAVAGWLFRHRMY